MLRVDIAIYRPGQRYRQRRFLTGSTISSSEIDIRRFFESKIGNRAVEWLEPLILQVATRLPTMDSNVSKILNFIRRGYRVAASTELFSMSAIERVVVVRESTSTAEGAAVESQTPTESILTQPSSLSQAISADEGCLRPAVTGVERPADARVTAYGVATISDTGGNVTLSHYWA